MTMFRNTIRFVTERCRRGMIYFDGIIVNFQSDVGYVQSILQVIPLLNTSVRCYGTISDL